jgi:hypothetical protein
MLRNRQVFYCHLLSLCSAALRTLNARRATISGSSSRVQMRLANLEFGQERML